MNTKELSQIRMGDSIEAMRLALQKAIEMLTDNREYIEANERPVYLASYDKAIADAEKALAEQAGPVVPEGWKLGSPITEAMHVAACKVLTQANGLDGTPQRMLDAMLAAAPAAPQAEHIALLKMIANRARSFPTFPMGYHLPEIFSAIGEVPPKPPAPQAEQPAQQEQIRSALEQYDLEHSPDYRKGWDDGRKKGYEVGHRHGLEQHLFAAQPAQQQWIETACALIKAADDAAAAADYMLDSNDCIKVLRGEWNGHLMNDQPTPQRQPLTPQEIREWWANENGLEDCAMSKLDDFEQVVRAIESKLREKNAAQRQPLTDEQERKAFEVFAARAPLGSYSTTKNSNGNYWASDTQQMWEAWKARAAHGIKGDA